jgi:hypothetical protein
MTVMDIIQWSKAEDTKCIHAVVLSDDLNDYNRIHDGAESDGDHVEPRGGSESEL